MKTKNKKCNKCDVVKPVDEFYRDKNKKVGRRFECKECKKQYYQDNREEISESRKQHYQANKEKILKRVKQYQHQYYEDNKEKRKQYQKQYNQDNKEKLKEYHKTHKAQINEQVRDRKDNDPVYALRCRVSNQIRCAITRNDGSKQGESVLQYLPYTIEQLKEHLENQFEDWMSWSNRVEWHIDHIIPQSKLPYDSMDDPNFQKCWALENLQPLEAKENIRLGNRDKV